MFADVFFLSFRFCSCFPFNFVLFGRIAEHLFLNHNADAPNREMCASSFLIHSFLIHYKRDLKGQLKQKRKQGNLSGGDGGPHKSLHPLRCGFCFRSSYGFARNYQFCCDTCPTLHIPVKTFFFHRLPSICCAM